MATNDYSNTHGNDQSSKIEDPEGVNDIPIFYAANPAKEVAALGMVLRYRMCVKCGDIHQNRHLCNDCFDDVNNPKCPFGLTRKELRNPSTIAALKMEQAESSS